MKKSQELKGKIMPYWKDFSLKSSGDILDRREGKIYEKNLFSDSDYQEIKKTFISSIVSYDDKWKVEQDDGLTLLKRYELRYSNNLGRKTWCETGQKHWLDGFSKTEKKEIKSRLSEGQKGDIQHTKNSKKLKERILNNLTDWGFDNFKENRFGWSSFKLFNKRNKYEEVSSSLGQLDMRDYRDYQEIWEVLKGEPFLNPENCQEPTVEEFRQFVSEGVNLNSSIFPLHFREISLSQQEKKVLQEPILNTNEAIMSAYRAIRSIKESDLKIEENLAKNEFSSGSILGLELSNLKEQKKNEKVSQSFTKNGTSLDNEIGKITKKITSKSKELREKILSNLLEWNINQIESLEPAGKFSNIKNSKFEISQFYLTNQDRQEIIWSIIENIRQNKNDWKIKKTIVDRCACQGEGVWELTKVINTSERIYYWKSGFTNEEFAEIEKILKNKIEIEDKSERHKHSCPEKGKGKPKSQKNDNYNDLTQEELNKEIKELKSEIEELKTNQNISISEQQIELQKREEKLEKLEKLDLTLLKKQNQAITSLLVELWAAEYWHLQY